MEDENLTQSGDSPPEPENLAESPEDAVKPLKHDEAYKLIFGHHDFAGDLLIGHIGGEWVKRIDLDSLEKLPTEHVSKTLDKRFTDMAWRAKLKTEGTWVNFRFLVEAQSYVDREMPLRALHYSLAELEEQWNLRPRGKKVQLEPTVLIVLYIGTENWTANRDVLDLMAPVPESMLPFVPRMKYELVNVIIPPAAGQLDASNKAEAVLAMECSVGGRNLAAAAKSALKALEGLPVRRQLVQS